MLFSQMIWNFVIAVWGNGINFSKCVGLVAVKHYNSLTGNYFYTSGITLHKGKQTAPSRASINFESLLSVPEALLTTKISYSRNMIESISMQDIPD